MNMFQNLIDKAEISNYEKIRKQERERVKRQKRAERTRCDNCGKKPAYKTYTGRHSITLQYRYENVVPSNMNLCKACKEEFDLIFKSDY